MLAAVSDGYVLLLPVVDLADVAPASAAFVESELVRTGSILLERQTGVALPDLDRLLDQRLHVGSCNARQFAHEQYTYSILSRLQNSLLMELSKT